MTTLAPEPNAVAAGTAPPEVPKQDEQAAANDRADYQLTAGLFRDLVGVRFQLLGLLPVVSGGILAVIEALDLAPASIVGPVLVGLVVTAGLMMYEIRNSQIHDNAVHRMRHLERLLLLSPATPSSGPGGFLGERTTRQLFLAPPTSSPSAKRLGDQKGAEPANGAIRHDVGLAVVYGVVLASWAAVLVFNVVLLIRSSADEVAWPLSSVTAVVVGVAGWRLVSAMSRMGRNPGIVYRLGPFMIGTGDDLPADPREALARIREEVDGSARVTWREDDYLKRTGGDGNRWRLAFALGVVTDRRVLRGLRLRHRIEPGAVDPENDDDLLGAFRRAIIGLELVDDVTDVDADELRARMIRRYGDAPWCSEDEVGHRVEWLTRVDAPGAAGAQASGPIV